VQIRSEYATGKKAAELLYISPVSQVKQNLRDENNSFWCANRYIKD
jgi:hypothetical protein